MAATFKFELVSPERLLLSEEVRQVDVPGSTGRFGVMAGHAPYMTTINPGVVEITRASGEVTKYFVRGGFADVGAGGLTILAERALPVAELNAAVIADEIKKAEDEIALAISEDAKAEAQRRLSEIKALAA